MKRQKTLYVNENILIDIMIIRGLDYIRYDNAKSLMYKFYLNKMYSGESYGQIEIIIAEKHIKNYLKVKKRIYLYIDVKCFT